MTQIPKDLKQNADLFRLETGLEILFLTMIQVPLMRGPSSSSKGSRDLEMLIPEKKPVGRKKKRKKSAGIYTLFRRGITVVLGKECCLDSQAAQCQSQVSDSNLRLDHLTLLLLYKHDLGHEWKTDHIEAENFFKIFLSETYFK